MIVPIGTLNIMHVFKILIVSQCYNIDIRKVHSRIK